MRNLKIVFALFCVLCTTKIMYADNYKLCKGNKEILGRFKEYDGGNRVVFKKQKKEKPANNCNTTPTPVITPSPLVVPTPIVEPPPPDEPFLQELEVIWAYPEDGDVDISTLVTPNLEMSMAVNGNRLSGEAFELKPVIERDYDTLLLGNAVFLTPILYSTEADGTKARHIRLVISEELSSYIEYRLVIKSDEHLIAADNAGSKLKEDVVIYFTTK